MTTLGEKTIKLVVWDLDDTFWKGTLSEGPITQISAHHELVKELARRGVANAICSKNDADRVKPVLVELGIWEYFVFARIDWVPKGPVIAAMIQDMALRGENVLFIDDNALNRQEVAYYVPDIQLAEPSDIATLLALPALKGKDDTALSRLKQYKILEAKLADRQAAATSNEEFLRACDISVSIHRDCPAQQARILELIARTNQLNYTKWRQDAASLEAMLNDKQVESRYLRVRDKYGDYGIAGFYMKAGGEIRHLLFSCRIMNMGVERWLYEKLGKPPVKIVGEVASPLDGGVSPDWIQEVDADRNGVALEVVRPQAKMGGRDFKVMLKGGCDLEQMADHFAKIGNLEKEFNYVSPTGFPIHTEHTEILKRCGKNTVERFGEVIDRLPFLDRQAFQTAFFDDAFAVYIYSALMDYTQGLYRYEDTDFFVSYFDVHFDVTDPKNWDYLQQSRGQIGLTREVLAWMADHFTFLGGLSPEAYAANLYWMRTQIPGGKPLVLINGSEIVLDHPMENERWRHHASMNAVTDEFVKANDNVFLCDMRTLVKSRADVTDNIRHYQRYVYLNMAKKIESLLLEMFPDVDFAPPSLIDKVKFFFKR